MQLSLLVLKTNQVEQVRVFYQELGLAFQEERHGNEPVHFSTTVQQTVIEIYPLPKSINVADSTTRLGFRIETLDKVLQLLKEKGYQVVSEAKQTEWGYMAVVRDPDDRLVELQQA